MAAAALQAGRNALLSLRDEVRAFLAHELAGVSDRDTAQSWLRFDRSFSEKVAARGWIGMTWPKEFGGAERSRAERYVVQEEMIAAGAPVAAHWVAERQSGPLILKVGTSSQKQRYLPAIAAGQLVFCIGMSEPAAGSDLAAILTRATRTGNGWRLNGQKLWTTHANHADVAIVLARTAPVDLKNRHAGLSQFLVDLKRPGITVRPINDMSGGAHFSEVIFDDVELADDALLGADGYGWSQVMAELSLERSGPERYLSSLPLLTTYLQSVPEGDPAIDEMLGKTFADLLTLRELSTGILQSVIDERDPSTEAAIVKDLGADFEQTLVANVAAATNWDARKSHGDRGVGPMLDVLTLLAPSFSIRGGTREILRGIIARELVR